MPRIRTDEDVLQVSLAALWVLASTAGSASVQEIAEAAVVSPRTFHRYFPQKEDCIRPAIADARREMLESLLAQPADLPMAEAWTRSFARAVDGPYAERTRLLLTATSANPALNVVWEDEFLSGARDTALLLRKRAGESDDLYVCETAAVMLVSLTLRALRDSVEGGGDPVDCVRARLASISQTGLAGVAGHEVYPIY